MKFPAFEAINLKNDTTDFKISDLPLSNIIPDKNQPRKNFNKELLEDLAASIQQHGVIQPIIVKNIAGSNKYQIIAGERRWRAAGIAKLITIPAIIQDEKNDENIAISLIENIQREDLNPIELAEAFYQLSTNYGLSHEAIATLVGKSRVAITNFLRLLNLSNYVRDLLVIGKIEMGHARAMLTLSSDQQALLAQKILDKNLTVRDVEKLVQMSKGSSENTDHSNRYSEAVNVWVSKLSKRLSSKVAVKINDKGEGRVVIYFKSPDEVDWLIEQVSTD